MLTRWTVLDGRGLSWRDVDKAYGILFAPGAEGKYREMLRNVPFDVEVVLTTGYDPTKSYRVEAEQRKSVILVLGVPLRSSGEIGPQGEWNSEKWSPTRVAAYTPFMLLHRLFDEANRFGGDALDSMTEYYTGAASEAAQMLTAETENEAYRRVLNSGVDTAAGRHNALGELDQVLADLFAKWCITGKIAFDPHDIHPDINRNSREGWGLVEARVRLLTFMRTFFPATVRHLREGRAYLI